MNGDLISRSALRFSQRYALADPESEKLIPVLAIDKAQIEAAPAVDAVEVIKCRDCFYWMKAKVNRSGNLVCPKSGMEIVATDFCSKAEKRRCKYEK